MNYRQVLITACVLLLFAVLGTAMVAGTWQGTHARIAANERATLLQKLSKLVPPNQYDNVLLDDVFELHAVELGPDPVLVYRARHAGNPVALVMTVVATEGYSGPIYLLVGVHYDGSLAGVRVVAHHETPGLGDGIEEDHSNWIFQFNGRSLDNPAEKGWAVRKDAGTFDQLTGATITPRAVVKAVHAALLYYRAHRDQLFTTPATAKTP
jgi:H+/Na+-translocating ferredoxin:NAD+ oxidoreductase subunit G